jgi:tRNA A37 methylthiotransferase MiaB
VRFRAPLQWDKNGFKEITLLGQNVDSYYGWGGLKKKILQQHLKFKSYCC